MNIHIFLKQRGLQIYYKPIYKDLWSLMAYLFLLEKPKSSLANSFSLQDFLECQFPTKIPGTIFVFQILQCNFYNLHSYKNSYFH